MLNYNLDKESLVEAMGHYPNSNAIVNSLKDAAGKTNNDNPFNTENSLSSADYLVGFSVNPISYCVGMADIVNSSFIISSLPMDKISLYYQSFFNSISKILDVFDGEIIKTMGDCVFFYFPESKNTNYDVRNCIDAGLEMVNSQKSISENLTKRGLPPVDFRVSADYGPVILMNSNRSNEIDLFGPPVNMSSKINRCAQKNQFVIGGDLKQVLKNTNGYGFKELDGFSLGFKFNYPVYHVWGKSR